MYACVLSTKNGGVCARLLSLILPSLIIALSRTTDVPHDNPPCPSGTKLLTLPWTPLPWRAPVDVCLCPYDTLCHGPYCWVNKEYRSSFVRGCSSCKCLRPCEDIFDCENTDCACKRCLYCISIY